MQGQAYRYFAAPSMASERLGFARGSSFLGHSDSLQGELKAVAAEFGALYELFDIGEGLGIAEFLAEFAEEWMEFRKKEEHFTADRGLQEKFLVDGAAQRERSSHAPVAADLPQPRVLL